MHPIAPMGRTLCLAALLAAPLAAGPGDGDPAYPSIRLTLHDTDPKLLPIVVQPDPDPKDVLIKHRVPYGPGKGLGPGLERRTRMRALQPDGAASEQLLVPTSPGIAGSIRVSVDATEGLVHGLSMAWLERRPIDGPVEPLRVEAIWNSEIGGLTLRAFVGDEQAGDLLHLPGELEATLRIAFSEGTLEVQGGGVGGLSAICHQDQIFGMQDATWSWGCEGLQPKAAFWFAQLRFEWMPYLYGSFYTVEGQALATSFLARDEILGVGAILAHPAPHDLLQVYENLQIAEGLYEPFGLESALTMLTEAALQGQLASTTPMPATLLLAQGAAKLVQKCSDQVVTLVITGSSDDGSPLKHRVNTLQRRIELLMARLLGFKSKSHARLLKTVELLVE